MFGELADFEVILPIPKQVTHFNFLEYYSKFDLLLLQL